MGGDERGYVMACVSVRMYLCVVIWFMHCMSLSDSFLLLLAHTNARGDGCASDHMKAQDLCFSVILTHTVIARFQRLDQLCINVEG